ncbi:hypothetical protein [Mangrovibrevibacter kandeliae]|uniref:hypothetical protein n=1 Tax=Mangrovibrevibacter kandeliae TaxID=2968473 RepID=UPI0021197C0D|nr:MULTISPECIES: hypothetical protein [unclassified Aurantimonas]MCQ8781651.1 hypothetical protein [Aurantimonas sp. CSK15Z-1]MCW4114901.1 hypothetical protein [Aurantimonas sp. MSK8Z-1]
MATLIGSLRQAAARGMLVTATCRSCGHAASFLASDLVAFANPGKPIEAIRFRCRECDRRDCEVVAAEFDRDRRPDIIIWRPSRLR